MHDDWLAETLQRADERFQRGTGSARGETNTASLVDSVRRRRARQVRRRQCLGVLAAFLLTAGAWTWSLDQDDWNGKGQVPSAVATSAIATKKASGSSGGLQPEAGDEPAQDPRLREEEIAQLKAEIAALDAEADRAMRFVDLYRAAEARRERSATLEEAALAEPLLPPEALADMEIDRAAGITVVSADAQANRFNRLDEAADSYRSVLKYFPDSRWASIARERLSRIEAMN